MPCDPAPLRRVGHVLLIFCALHVFACVGDGLASLRHAYAIDVLTGGLGWLLARGNASVAAVALLLVAAGAVVFGTGLPAHLWITLPAPSGAREWLRVIWADGWALADVGLLVWTARELTLSCQQSSRA